MSDDRRAFYRGEDTVMAESAPIPANTNEDSHEAQDTEPQSEKKYQAARNEKMPSMALTVIYADNTTYTIGYSQFVEAFCTSHQRASICFQTRIITLEGRNLFPLEHYLATGRTSALREFHPGRHEEPSAGMPLITSITVDINRELVGQVT